jgi:hypothetical protein
VVEMRVAGCVCFLSCVATRDSASHNVAIRSICLQEANCTWGGGWHNAPFCVLPDGKISMTGVTPGKANLGHFDASCDRIQWDNVFDDSAWCKRGGSEADCAPANGGGGSGGGPAGPFKFLDLSAC